MLMKGSLFIWKIRPCDALYWEWLIFSYYMTMKMPYEGGRWFWNTGTFKSVMQRLLDKNQVDSRNQVWLILAHYWYQVQIITTVIKNCQGHRVWKQMPLKNTIGQLTHRWILAVTYVTIYRCWWDFRREDLHLLNRTIWLLSTEVGA